MIDKKEERKIENNIFQKNPFTFKAVYLGIIFFIFGLIYNLKFIKLIIPSCHYDNNINFFINVVIFLLIALGFFTLGTKYLLKAKNHKEDKNIRYIVCIILYCSIFILTASFLFIFKSYLYCSTGSL